MLLSVLDKVFAWIIFDLVHYHLREHQHLKHLGFTTKRSTIDRILAVRVLTEFRRVCQQRLLAGDVDLHKVFHLVNQDTLWRILSLRGASPKLINQSDF